jgi:hypothetical protein
MARIMESEQLTTADLANAASGRDAENVVRVENREQQGRGSDDPYAGPLLPHDFSDDMRTKWENIQTGFVDDPRVSVQHADELVAMAIKRLAESFADERAKLEQQWSRGGDVSTEDLRQALQRYRAFFQRLLSL